MITLSRYYPAGIQARVDLGLYARVKMIAVAGFHLTEANAQWISGALPTPSFTRPFSALLILRAR
jgi:hypothetical protein